MPESKVVDAWALLAWLRNELPAASRVRDSLQQAEEGTLQLFMSWINAGEVYYMLARKHDARAETVVVPSIAPPLNEPDRPQLLDPEAGPLRSQQH